MTLCKNCGHRIALNKSGKWAHGTKNSTVDYPINTCGYDFANKGCSCIKPKPECDHIFNLNCDGCNHKHCSKCRICQCINNNCPIKYTDEYLKSELRNKELTKKVQQ